MKIFQRNKIIALSYALFLITLSQCGNDKVKDNAEQDQAPENQFWASSTTNIHQPVYTPGFGPYHAYSPLFMTPPPPQVAYSNLIPPSPVYLPSEKKIKRNVKVMSYPQHLSNPMNYFSMPKTYNPYFGTQHPVNMNHPFNLLHGPAPFPNYLSGGAGMQMGSAPISPQLNYQQPFYGAANIGMGPIMNPMANQFGQMGYGTGNGQYYDVYSTAYDEKGTQGPYNEIPNAGPRKLLGLMNKKPHQSSSISNRKHANKGLKSINSLGSAKLPNEQKNII
jgi:hypothetical protein